MYSSKLTKRTRKRIHIICRQAINNPVYSNCYQVMPKVAASTADQHRLCDRHTSFNGMEQSNEK